MSSYVEELIPAGYLVSLGVYMQTCAHIEYCCGKIYQAGHAEAISMR